MDDVFKIFVEQLRDGREKTFDDELDPTFLEINEEDLSFTDPIFLSGTAYLAEQELIINWSIRTQANIACSICNQWVKASISIDNAYFSEPLSEIKTGVYSFKELLRETILLEVPLFAECEGSCPRRKEYATFLKDPSDEVADDEGYHPFADLDWKP